MVEIKEEKYAIKLILMGRSLIIPKEEYLTFKENLIVEYNENKWVDDNYVDIPISKRIEIEELSFVDFNLLYYKHQPNYNDTQMKKLNIRHLLSVCNWSVD